MSASGVTKLQLQSCKDTGVSAYRAGFRKVSKSGLGCWELSF